jgi:hypothetical protein
MTLRKREDAGNWKKKCQITRCEEVDLEEAVDVRHGD